MSNTPAEDGSSMRTPATFAFPAPSSRSLVNDKCNCEQRVAACPITCPGARISFASSVYTTYPWWLHEPNTLPYTIIGIGEDGLSLLVRSIACKKTLAGTENVCHACASTITCAEVLGIKSRAASTPASGMNYRYLNFLQLCERLNLKNKTINELKITVGVLCLLMICIC